MNKIVCAVCRGTSIREVRDANLLPGQQISFNYSFHPDCRRTLAIVECLSCSHQFCYPIPANFSSHYQDIVDAEYLQHAASRTATYERVLPELTARTSGRRLLDVGCATGDFLEAASKHGFEAVGMEPSNWSSAIATQRGFTVHRVFVEQADPQVTGTFDVITLWGVIEHFVDPRGAIESLSRLLRPGGIIALWTGDVSSITSRLMGSRWWYWQGQHIQYFTEASLRKLADISGLASTEVLTYPFCATLESLRNSVRRYAISPLITPLLPLLFVAGDTITIKLPGEMFAILRSRAE